LTQLVDEITVQPDLPMLPVIFLRAWLIKRAWRPTWASPIIAFNLSTRHQCRYRVNYHDVNGSRANQLINNFQSGFTSIGLGNQQICNINSHCSSVGSGRVQHRQRRQCLQLLHFRDRMQRHRCFAGTLDHRFQSLPWVSRHQSKIGEALEIVSTFMRVASPRRMIAKLRSI